MNRTQTRRRLAPSAIWPLTALAIGIAHDGRTQRTDPPRPPRTARPGAEAGPRKQAAYGRLPLHFERNVGQADGSVRYLAHGPGYGLFLSTDEAVLELRRGGGEDAAPAVVRARFLGARSDPEVVGEEPLPGFSHYLRGNDPSKWRTGVPHFGRVTYREMWRGIDLTCYGKQGQLEYDFVIAPGADPGLIRLAYHGVEGMSLDAAGNLSLRTARGEIVQQAPTVYQPVGEERRKVEGRFDLAADGGVGFAVGTFDRSLPLVIDPVLVYSTYVGGSGLEHVTDVAVDGTGSAYITGYTASTDFPTRDPYQTFRGGLYDVFVTKLAATGSSIVYSTYLGGTDSDQAHAIAVDGAGSAYVTGMTRSRDFPAQGAYQADQSGDDAFVAKLSPAGSSLGYSTYLGGSGAESGVGIAVDGTGSAYVTGWTESADFPTRGPYLGDQGKGDGFVTKLTPDGGSLAYSTYLGGTEGDQAYAIAVDGAGDAYVTGGTQSPDFPTQGPIQTRGIGFVTKLSSSGSSLVYSTYLGGSGVGIAVDGDGGAYVAAEAVGWLIDVFAAKLSASGDALVYWTPLAGHDYDRAGGIAVDPSGNAYVTGHTFSTDFPVAGLHFPDQPGVDAFVTKVSASGSLVYSTYLGGSGSDQGRAVAVDGAGSAFVAGWTDSTDFPTQGAYQLHRGGLDAFVTKLTGPGSDFYTVTPCRLLDTRDAAGTFGGPALAAGADRVFPLYNRCGIPPTARALSVNLTVTQPTANGNLRLYPAGIPLPLVSSVNYVAGLTRANNAITSLNANGELAVRCSQASGTAHFILDVNGYFQ